MNKSVVFSLIVLGLAAIALTLIASSRIQDFQDYHASLARESASSAAQAIAGDLVEKQRLVEIFGYDHLPQIRQLADDPENETLHTEIARRIALFFPDYFTFTIADSAGKPFVEDFDGLIGELCAGDLNTYASGNPQLQRIHPHPDVYHFDTLARLDSENRQIILFISFHADGLGRVLKNAQVMGHRLMLIQPQASDLIEVTDSGSRIHLDRNDYRLSANELDRILFRAPVPGTRWQAVDFRTSQLFTNYTHGVIFQASVIFVLFLAVTVIMMRLIQKEEQLRKTAEANKDDFISVVSHELRTPITSISGSLSLLANGAAGAITDKAGGLLDLAQNNCRRLNRLIDDLLDLQKIEAGKLDFDMKSVDLDALLQQCIDNNRGYADTFGAKLDLLTPSTGFLVNVDEHRIMQVMSNLLSNAAKYGAEQDSIVVSANRNEHFARISVTDHGNGIPDSFRDSIFQKFAQAESGSERASSGTGLGLSVVKSIIEQHSGRVGYYSRIGLGSTFFIDLPLAPPNPR